MDKRIETLLTCQDEVWYRQVVRNHPGTGTCTEEEEREIIARSMQTAEAVAGELKRRYGLVSGMTLAELLGVQVRRTEEELRTPFLYMGIFDPEEGTIILNNSTLSAIQCFIEEHKLNGAISSGIVEEITLFHEIFHFVEEMTPGIYTRSRMLKRRMFRCFPYFRGVDAAGEIGAIHFSKQMKGISYSPCLYEFCLLLKVGSCSIDFLTGIR